MILRNVLLSACVLVPVTAPAATFCATNATQFRNALAAAATNGEADDIRLSRTTFQGTAAAPFLMSFSETHGVRISGGWSVLGSVCYGQSMDATRTTLDGGLAVPALEILSAASHAIVPITVEGLTLRNGYTTTHLASGLAVYGFANGAPTITVDRVIVHSNAAGVENTPAVRLSSDHHFVRFSNSIVRGNTMVDSPAVMLLSNNGGVAAHNLTMVDNSDPGQNGAILLYGVSGSMIHNSVFWNNAGGDLYAQGNVRYYNNRYGTTQVPDLMNLYGFNNSAVTDPRLDANLRPLSDSPLRNVGGTPVAARDVFGQDRKLGGWADIGAAEHIE
jgi:hypothetical protein